MPLRRILRKRPPASPALTTVEPPAAVLTAPAPIRELHTRGQLITVTRPNDSTSYQSLILAIDPQRKLLWLDELFPMRASVRAGDTLEVSHHRNGELLVFNTTVIAHGKSYGVEGLALRLPEAVHYRPRRQWPRLTLAQHPTVPVVLSLPGVGAQYGQVLDISAGGVRVSVPGSWHAQLRPGDRIPLCQMTLAPGLTVRCRARICAYKSHHRPWRQTHISLAFTDLSRKASEDVQRFVLNRLRAAPDNRAA